MDIVVTIFCSTYYVTVCPLDHLIKFQAVHHPNLKNVEIYYDWKLANKI